MGYSDKKVAEIIDGSRVKNFLNYLPGYSNELVGIGFVAAGVNGLSESLIGSGINLITGASFYLFGKYFNMQADKKLFNLESRIEKILKKQPEARHIFVED